MDKEDKLHELLEARAQADQELERMRTPVTILFSDIKGSTPYFEKKGDVEGVAMIDRHNTILFPVIEGESGRVVKTIGDSIMACFEDPAAAVRAAVGMQRALEEDREGRPEIEQIHVRIGLHTGLGLIKEGDIFGDVVNTAARVQRQAQIEQILITDILLDTAKNAGFQCARMGRADLRGKDEPIDLFAVAWSETATEQLIEELQDQYEKKLKESQRRVDEIEEEFLSAQDQWRADRRNLNATIEQLEDAIEEAREAARQQASAEAQSELQFELEQANRARQLAEQELAATVQRFNAERENLRAQINGMQASVIEAMERSNNPSRMAVAVREQVETRLADAKQEWELQWDSERRRLNAEIDRLRKSGGTLVSEARKDAARRALLERLGKVSPGPEKSAARTAEQWEREYNDAQIKWEAERDQLGLKIRKLETELQRSSDTMRNEIYQEMRWQYEPQIAEAKRECNRLEKQVESLTADLSAERDRFKARVAELDRAIPEAAEAVRKQVTAELQIEFDIKLDEANRLRSRAERKCQDAVEEAEAESRRAKKRLATLEEELKEAKEAAFRAQKTTGRSAV